MVTPSRNSRSCEIIISMPGYFSSHCSSQSTASRSRWLVGSSSSSRSDGIISARARLSRTRQPPEKSETGMRCVSERKAKPVQQPSGARFGVVAVDVGHLLMRERRLRPNPRPRSRRLRLRGSRALRYRPKRRNRSPHPAATAFPARRSRCARASADRDRPCPASISPWIAANRLDLPQPLRPTTPTRAPACSARSTLDSSRRSPRRRAKFLNAIMGVLDVRSGNCSRSAVMPARAPAVSDMCREAWTRRSSRLTGRVSKRWSLVPLSRDSAREKIQDETPRSRQNPHPTSRVPRRPPCRT